MVEDSRQLISAAEAAAELGVSQRRVQALAASGVLPSARIGNRLLFDVRAVSRRAAGAHAKGRPFAPGVAWAVLAYASGLSWPVENASLRWRYRVRAADIAEAAREGRFARRADLHAFRVAARDAEQLRADAALILAGVSASERHQLDIAAPDILEAYIGDGDLQRVRDWYWMEPADPASANVLLRVVPDAIAAILHDDRYAPRAAVAVDLLESDDDRTRRAGEQALVSDAPAR